jgi:hypothetical protein
LCDGIVACPAAFCFVVELLLLTALPYAVVLLIQFNPVFNLAFPITVYKQLNFFIVVSKILHIRIICIIICYDKRFNDLKQINSQSN